MSKTPAGADPPSVRRKRNPRYGLGSEYWDNARNRFVAVLWVEEEGRKRRVCCFGATADAAREAREVRRRHLAGDITPTKQAVHAYLTEYIASRAGWSARTRAYNRALLADHLDKPLGKIRLPDLTARQIATWLARAQAAGTGAAVLRNAFGLLHAACAYAVRLGELETNRCARVDAPPRPKPQPAHLTAEQARALLATAHGSRHYCLLLLLLNTGLRLGEALGLRWQDVTLGGGSGTLRIEHALSGHDTGAYALQAPKTPKSRREVALVEPLVGALRARGTAQKRERLRAGAAWAEPIPGLIFTSQHGQPYGRSAIGRALRRLCQQAGVPDVSPHDLRRTWATLQADAGTPPSQIRDAMGHTSVRMTMEYVQASALAQGPELARRMAALLGPEGDSKGEAVQ